MIALHLHDFYGASVVLSARHVKHHFLQNKRSKQKPFLIYFLPHGGIYSLRELFLVDCKMKLDA
jgi:hypothetical protein